MTEQKTIVGKDELIEYLEKEFREMMFDRPACTYEWIYNQAIDDIIDNMRTNMDHDWKTEKEIKLNDNKDDD